MRTSGLRRCALGCPSIRMRNNVLRLRRPVARGKLAASAWSVATRQSGGLLRVRGQVGLRTPAPDPHGSLPDQRSLAGRHPTTASRETRVAGCHPPACAKLRSLPDGRKSPQPRFSTAYSAPTTRSGGWARIPAVPFLAPRDIGIRRSPILARHALAHHVPATPPHGDLEGQRPRKRLRIWSARSFPNGNTNPRLTPCTLLKGPPFRLGRSSLGISMSRMGSSRLHSFTCAQYPTIPCG